MVNVGKLGILYVPGFKCVGFSLTLNVLYGGVCVVFFFSVI